MADVTSPLAHLNSDAGAPPTALSPDWVIAVSASEVARGALAPDTDGRARAALHMHGCVLLRGAFPRATVEAMHREYVAQFGIMDVAEMRNRAAKPPPNRLIQVGAGRYDMILPMTGAFGRTEVFANDLLLGFLAPLLGGDMHLNSFTAVVSHPGAPQQRAHRDYPHLFLDPGVGPNLLVHAVNLVVPLIDVDMETGPTGVWLGSHRWQDVSVESEAITVCPVRRGDCMLLDYRTVHAGLANRSARARPIVYMVYARPWFFDHGNHVRLSRVPVDMPLSRCDELPASVRPLMSRAHYYAMLARWHEVDTPGPAVEPLVVEPSVDEPASRSKLGRNDACPCGSAKKYKHCHGRIG